MNTKLIVYIVAIVLIISAVAVAGVYVANYLEEQNRKEGIAEPEGRFKIDIDGIASYGILGVSWWEIRDINYRVEQMIDQDAALSISLDPLGFFDPWMSEEIYVKAELTAPTGYVYKTEKLDLGRFNVWAGDSKSWALHMDMIVPDTSPFTLKILLYEGNQQKVSQSFSGIQILPANI